jgi:ATP-dependent DNA helicase RecQ
VYLTDNYRSTAHIIAAANAMIEPAADRMKVDHPILVDRHRRKAPPGGPWQERDPVSRGRVQVLDAGTTPATQAMAVMAEFARLASLDPDWDWAKCAVIAREWKLLDPVRAYCELADIPVQMARDDTLPFWRLRETQALVDWVKQRESRLLDAAAVRAWLDTERRNGWRDLLAEAVEAYALETGDAELPREHFLDWLAEWGRELRRRQTGLLLVTAHSAKGLEFDHVAVLDGGWERRSANEDADAIRRLYYVAMTRARQGLILARMSAGNRLIDQLQDGPHLLRRENSAVAAAPPELARCYERLTLADVDLGYAGRQPPGASVHRAIAELEAGDALQVRFGTRIELLDGRGRVVGRLAKRYEPCPTE